MYLKCGNKHDFYQPSTTRHTSYTYIQAYIYIIRTCTYCVAAKCKGLKSIRLQSDWCRHWGHCCIIISSLGVSYDQATKVLKIYRKRLQIFPYSTTIVRQIKNIFERDGWNYDVYCIIIPYVICLQTMALCVSSLLVLVLFKQVFSERYCYFCFLSWTRKWKATYHRLCVHLQISMSQNCNRVNDELQRRCLTIFLSGKEFSLVTTQVISYFFFLWVWKMTKYNI